MLKRLLILVSLMLALAACQGQTTVLPTFTPNVRPTNTPPPPPPTSDAPTPVPYATLPPALEQPNPRAEPAQIWVVQGNPAFEPIDMYAGAKVIGARFVFGASTQQAIQLPSGNYPVRVVKSGDSNTSEKAIFEDEITLEARQSYVVLFYGDENSPQLGLFPYDRSPLDPNTSRLQVLHAVANGPEIDLEADGLPLVEGLRYDEGGEALELPSGDYQFNLRAGTGSLENSEQVLKAQESYLFLLMGNPNFGKFQTLLLSQPATPRSLFRVVHGAFDAPPLRVLLDEFLVIENLDYRAFSDRFISFNSGVHNLRVETMTVGDAPLLDLDLEFPANVQGELLLFGRAENLQAKLLPLAIEPVTSGEARLSIINALPLDQAIRPEINTLIFDETNPLPLNQSPLEFGVSSVTAPITAGVQTFRFWLDETLFYETEALPIEGGNLYTYVIMGRSGADSLLLTTPLTIKDFGADSAPTDIPTAPTTLRVINALSNQEAIQVLVEGETVIGGVAYGFISDPVPMPSEQTVNLQITGGANLRQDYFSRGEINTTLVIAGEADPQIIIINETEPLPDGVIRGIFINALPRQDTITMNFRPTDTTPEDVLANPQEDSSTQDEVNYDVGNQIGQGQFELVNMPVGEFILEVNVGATGETFAQLYLTAELNHLYYYILSPKAGEVELLSVALETKN